MSPASRFAATGSSAFANPKSNTFTVPSGRTFMFAGFRSRWMMPCSCTASRASAICLAIGNARPAERTASDALGKVFALDELHHQGLNALGVLQPINGRNVRVIQRGQDFGVAFEPGQPLASADKDPGGFSERCRVQRSVTGTINLAHAARADRRHDIVRPEPRADERAIVGADYTAAVRSAGAAGIEFSAVASSPAPATAPWRYQGQPHKKSQ